MEFELSITEKFHVTPYKAFLLSSCPQWSLHPLKKNLLCPKFPHFFRNVTNLKALDLLNLLDAVAVHMFYSIYFIRSSILQ